MALIADPQHTRQVMQRVVDAHYAGEQHDATICARCLAVPGSAREGGHNGAMLAYRNAKARGLF